MSALPLGTDLSERERSRVADLIFEAAPVPIMVTDPEPLIVRVNRAFTDVTGYSAPEVLGRNPRILASGRHPRDFYQKMWETIVTTGGWEGEIWNRRKNGEVYPESLAISAIRDDRGNVTHYIAIFSDISSRKRMEAHLRHLSYHDPLTGLPNRALFMDRLDQALHRARRMKHRVALLFLDLDNFKTVNDTAGHVTGDHALQEVAARLGSLVRDMDTVARMGGDEFAILMSDVAAPEQATALAARVLEALSRPIVLSGASHSFPCSIGIGVGPADDDAPERLLQRADSAMYVAKRGGGGRYAVAG